MDAQPHLLFLNEQYTAFGYEFPSCEKNNCRNNCSIYSFSSIPRYFNVPSTRNYSWFTETVCVHSSLCSVQSHLDAMDYHQLGFKVTQLVLPWNVQGGDYQIWFVWLTWGGSNHEQKDGETQTFPIMIDVSEFGMASLIFQEQRKKLWKIQRYLSDSCKTEMSNEITLLLFVPTSI